MMNKSQTTVIKEEVKKGHQRDEKSIQVVITDLETNEEVVNYTGESVLFSVHLESEEEAHEITAGMAGSLSVASTMAILESSMTAVVKALKQMEVPPHVFIEAVGEATSRVVKDNYSEKEQMMAMIMATVKMSEMKGKNPFEDLLK